MQILKKNNTCVIQDKSVLRRKSLPYQQIQGDMSDTLLSFSGIVGGCRGVPDGSVGKTITVTLLFFSLFPQIEEKSNNCNLLDKKYYSFKDDNVNNINN